jgi:hypothetical protein
MATLRWLVEGLVMLMACPALAQANANCQVRPKTLAAMRHCYRSAGE